MAQQYALNFGKASSGEEVGQEPRVIIRSSELVVTTLPDADDAQEKSDGDDLEKQPRGFFADQFEVLSPSFLVFQRSNRLSRTNQTTPHTSSEQGLRSTVRQTVGLMLLLVELGLVVRWVVSGRI